jgi:acyl-homoserine-lactone acylase
LRARSATVNLPGNGADGELGVFRVTWSQPAENHTYNIAGGDSWVGLIEFGKSVRARVLLSYGNSSQEGNPHNGDQLKPFSEEKMRDAHFYPKDVEAGKVRKELRKGDGFVEVK